MAAESAERTLSLVSRRLGNGSASCIILLHEGFVDALPLLNSLVDLGAMGNRLRES